MREFFNKKSIMALLFFTLVYTSWQLLRPVEIIAVHDDNTLLVKNFPLFKSWKIAWWERNKEQIKEKYGLPVIESDGDYIVFIQGFGEGYKIDPRRTDGSEFVCFQDMKQQANCIDKDPLLAIGSARNSKLFYW